MHTSASEPYGVLGLRMAKPKASDFTCVHVIKPKKGSKVMPKPKGKGGKRGGKKR